MGRMEECIVWWCPGGYHSRQAEINPAAGLPWNHRAAHQMRNSPHDAKALRRRKQIRIELGGDDD